MAAVSVGILLNLVQKWLGHAQLTEAVRFRSAWEGTASLGIRAGEVSALGVYDAGSDKPARDR